MKKLIAGLFILTALAGPMMAADFSSFPSPIERGDIMISVDGGLASLSFGGLSRTGFAVIAKGEYALPTPIAFTAGVETGLNMWNYGSVTLSIIPLMGRFAWHPNWGVDKLDTYAAAKAGFMLGTFIGNNVSGSSLSGFATGFDLGAKYFLTPSIAVGGELGYSILFAQYSNPGLLNITGGVTFRF